ncbi:XRE family transcriptional regulator [Burkholderia glumae]|uniref:XRE family transcriptional regulator n=1 Tax=Burkholderia glumae TaxID=337 RepID=UPI002151D3FE|nr:S24 family peptidase [Burkholderia glumae]
MSTTFADRLKQARRDRGLSQTALAERVGVSQTTIAALETGRASTTVHWPAIADVLAVNLKWLVHGEGPKDYAPAPGSVVVWEDPAELPANPNRVWIDRYDYRFSAGNGHIQWEIREKNALPFNKGFFRAIGSRPEDCRLVDVVGDSMAPFLFDRDMMMVDMSKRTPRDGKIYAVLFEEEPLVKQIFKEPGGGLILHSYNPQYPDRVLRTEHLENLQIVGQCVYRSGSTLSV